MRQHLGGLYGPELNVARNWLSVGRPLPGPRPGAIGVKAHHVFQVVQVIDPEHVLAISGNDHNAVLTRIRSTSNVLGWRDVSEESGNEHGIRRATTHEQAGFLTTKTNQTMNVHFAVKDAVGNCSVVDGLPSSMSGMRLVGANNGYPSVQDAQLAFSSVDCKQTIERG
jgi:hypothetical protein